MSNFTSASTLERQKMTQLFQKHQVGHYYFTPSEDYDKWDGLYITKKLQTVCFEVKNRNITSTAYDSTMIEKSKYDFLTQEQKIGQAQLFVFFKDDKYFTTTLSASDPDYYFGQTSCPQTTMGYNEYVLKDVVYIPINPKQIYDL